jgi:hypothetical protein
MLIGQWNGWPWRWHKVRRADIPKERREEFERYGETLMALAIESGERLGQELAIGKPLAWVGQQEREQIVEWLRERRDIAARREDRLEAVEVAILIFAVSAVVLDLLRFVMGR